MNNDLISREALKKALNYIYDCAYIDSKSKEGIASDIIDEIDNAPTVEPEITEKQAILFLINNGWLVNHDKELRERWERPQGEWVCKEDVIHYIATQYSEHNELVPIWLSIGDLIGGAE